MKCDYLLETLIQSSLLTLSEIIILNDGNYKAIY